MVAESIARARVFFSDYASQVQAIEKQSQGTLDVVEKVFLLRDWEKEPEAGPPRILFVNDGTASGSLASDAATSYPTDARNNQKSPRPADYIPGQWMQETKTYTIAEEGRDTNSYGSKGSENFS